MSVLDNQSKLNPTSAFYAPASGGGGGGSNFNAASISSLSVSSVNGGIPYTTTNPPPGGGSVGPNLTVSTLGVNNSITFTGGAFVGVSGSNALNFNTGINMDATQGSIFLNNNGDTGLTISCQTDASIAFGFNQGGSISDNAFIKADSASQNLIIYAPQEGYGVCLSNVSSLNGGVPWTSQNLSIQSGFASAVAYKGTVSFPTPFSSDKVAVQITLTNNGLSGSNALCCLESTWGLNGVSTSGFATNILVNGTGATCDLYWTATQWG